MKTKNPGEGATSRGVTNPEANEADMDDATGKVCRKCRLDLPLDSYYVRNGRHQATCKRCLRAQNKAWAQANPEVGRAATAKWRQQNPDKAADGFKRWYAANREYSAQRVKAWREENPEAVKRHQARYRVGPGRSKKAIERGREWREANPDKVAAWVLKNPERMRVKTAKRRAIKLSATLGPVDYGALWESSGGICALCRTPVDRRNEWPNALSPSMDHIVPLSRGGAHSQSNLQLTHLVCNLRKGDRLLPSSPDAEEQAG